MLIGQIVDGNNVVHAARVTRNVWPDEAEKATRFRIDEQEWLAIEMEAASADLDVIGVFHSHPDHPPVASPRDLAWAAFSGYSYLITEVRAGEPQSSRSWQLSPARDNFFEEDVEIAEAIATK